MTWLLGIGGLLKQGLSALFGLIRAHPWQTALIASLCLSAWFYMGKRSETRRADAWHHAWQAQKNASDAAAAAQKALNAKIKTGFKETAHDAKSGYDQSGPRVRDATDNYAATHRLRPESGKACGGNPAAQGANPDVSAGLPASALVAISEPDLQACAAWVRIGVGAHNMAVDLLDRDLAEVAK
jgi:hypothetical protein